MKMEQSIVKEDDEVRERLINASIQYMNLHGSQKLRMVDVARLAKVSRATVYNYFESKEDLVAAASSAMESTFFDGIRAEISRHKRFDDKISAICIFVRMSWTHRDHIPWYGFLSPIDEATFIAIHAADHAAKMMDFLTPYVQEARASGEISSNLDLRSTTDWLTRIIMSFSYSPANQKMQEAKHIKAFIRKFLIDGLAP